MRVGVLTGGQAEDLSWAQRLGFRSIEWMQFHDGPARPNHADWKPFAERFAAEAKARDIRISAIGALYQNPLDPKQSDFARAVFRRASPVLRRSFVGESQRPSGPVAADCPLRPTRAHRPPACHHRPSSGEGRNDSSTRRRGGCRL